MPMIDVNDTTLYYERTGNGPAILFVHGMCGDADVWADQALRFSDRYTCVRYDRRGHSRSARGEADLSDALHADDAAALIETMELASCLVVSSSGGAAISVDVALRHGHLLRGAVFSEPPLFSLDAAAARDAMRDLGPLVERVKASGDTHRFVDEFFSLLCPGLWSILDESRKDRYRANGGIGLADLQSPSLDIAPADLAASAVPTLVIAGDRSHPSLQAIARVLAGSLPDARFVELANCGHVTYAEQPEDFADAVATFADELARHTPLAARYEVTAARSPATDDSERFEVESADGTSLAVWVDGDGPALVMVHGSIADHTTFDPFIEVLRNDMTTYSMDRRGFGASGDSTGYAIERDFEDVAAVVEAVAARTGRPVTLWGHSYGANCAMGGAALTRNVDHLVLYEPSLGLAYPPGSIEAIAGCLARGDREGAIVVVLRETLDMTDAEIDAMRSNPLWPVRLAAAHTVPRECRVEDTWRYERGQFAAITAPTLLLAGSESTPALTKATHEAAAAIPDARIHVLEGHRHFAHKTAPTMVAALVGEFVSS